MSSSKECRNDIFWEKFRIAASHIDIDILNMQQGIEHVFKDRHQLDLVEQDINGIFPFAIQLVTYWF